MAPVCFQQKSPEPCAPGTSGSRRKSIRLGWLLALFAAFGVTGFAEQALTPGAGLQLQDDHALVGVGSQQVRGELTGACP